MSLEVAPHAERECLFPDGGYQLLEDRRTFLVGDAVEIEQRGIRIRDIGSHRMRGDQLVLAHRGRPRRERQRVALGELHHVVDAAKAIA